jgi:ParB/RepB/Spo0J family partition protein
MSVNVELGSVRHIPLDALTLSQTGSQAERRAHFDKAAIKELGESIKTLGLLSPIIARNVPMVSTPGLNGIRVGGKTYFSPDEAKEAAKNTFEIVAGERRFMAAKSAGLEAIAVDVRELTDEQVLEIQLVENLQREGLHELAEAEGYEQLQRLGHTAEEIADKVGKSKSYVYGRMKLSALGPAAREMFYRGKLTASTALLLSRMADPASQREAAGKITQGYDGEPMSYRQARDFIEREYMLRLADASFPTGDADLLPKAGACGPCPKRTGNHPELFADIKSGDVCTDPACFKLKREVWSKLQIAEAKQSGRAVIVGPEAKKVAPGGWVTNGFATLDRFCTQDAKGRTFKQLLGKKSDVIQLLQMPKTGEIVEVVKMDEAVKAARKLGTLEEHAKGSSPYGSALPRKKVDPAKEAEQTAFRDRLLIAIHKNAPTQIERATLLKLVERQIDNAYNVPQGFFTAWGWDADSFDKVPKLTDSQLRQLIFELELIEDLPSDLDAEVAQLTKAAKTLGVDVKKVKADVPKVTAPAKVAKKAKSKK